MYTPRNYHTYFTSCSQSKRRDDGTVALWEVGLLDGRRSQVTVFLCLRGDGFEVFVQTALEEVVLYIQLLLPSNIHRIYTEVWERHPFTSEREREAERRELSSSHDQSGVRVCWDLQAQGMWGKMTSMLIFSLSPRDVSTYSSGWTWNQTSPKNISHRPLKHHPHQPKILPPSPTKNTSIPQRTSILSTRNITPEISTSSQHHHLQKIPEHHFSEL